MRRSKRPRGVLVGAAIVAVGVAFLLPSLGVSSAPVVLILILVGAHLLIEPAHRSGSLAS